MILHNPPEPKTAKNSVHPVLVTDHHDEEIERLTAALGARPLNEIKLPPAALPPGVAAVRQTTFGDLGVGAARGDSHPPHGPCPQFLLVPCERLRAMVRLRLGQQRTATTRERGTWPGRFVYDREGAG
jgi:hypothetical protein